MFCHTWSGERLPRLALLHTSTLTTRPRSLGCTGSNGVRFCNGRRPHHSSSYLLCSLTWKCCLYSSVGASSISCVVLHGSTACTAALGLARTTRLCTLPCASKESLASPAGRRSKNEEEKAGERNVLLLLLLGLLVALMPSHVERSVCFPSSEDVGCTAVAHVRWLLSCWCSSKAIVLGRFIC